MSFPSWIWIQEGKSERGSMWLMRFLFKSPFAQKGSVDPMLTTGLRLVLFSWFFYVMNAAGDPYWTLEQFLSKADCDEVRTWAITSHFKAVGVASPDQAAKDAYASPCKQAYVLQQ